MTQEQKKPWWKFWGGKNDAKKEINSNIPDLANEEKTVQSHQGNNIRILDFASDKAREDYINKLPKAQKDPKFPSQEESTNPQDYIPDRKRNKMGDQKIYLTLEQIKAEMDKLNNVSANHKAQNTETQTLSKTDTVKRQFN